MHRSFRSPLRLASLGFGQDDRACVEKTTLPDPQGNDELLPQRLKPARLSFFNAGINACSTPRVLALLFLTHSWSPEPVFFFITQA